MDRIKFKKSYLKNYAIITEPGKYALRVSNDVTDNNLVTNEDGLFPRYIVTLKAIPADKTSQLREVFRENEEVDIECMNGVFMTGNVYQKEGVKLPAKGEVVDCVVEYVKSRDSEELVLRVISLKVHPSIQAPKLDIMKFFEDTVITPPVGEVIQHS